MPYFYQRFTVTGFGEFPIDMLRYDCCFPENESDSGRIAPRNYGQRSVKLARTVERKSDHPTQARWQSFGWSVDEDSIETR